MTKNETEIQKRVISWAILIGKNDGVFCAMITAEEFKNPRKIKINSTMITIDKQPISETKIYKKDIIHAIGQYR